MVYDVAIIGGGYSGLLSLFHLVKNGPAGARYAVFEPREQLGQGLAYSTRHTGHLLNVIAANMSALGDDPDHLVRWLESAQGRNAARSLKLSDTLGAAEYIPRALYALYLGDICTQAFAMAEDKGISVEHIKNKAENIRQLSDGAYEIATEPEWRHRARTILLALGNLLPQKTSELRVVQDVWNFNYRTLKGCKDPVAIIGSGLTMADTLLSIREGGYEGEVIVTSRRGHLPHVHDDIAFKYTSQAETLARTPQRLCTLIRAFRSEAADCFSQCNSWQPVFRQWRPYTQTFWANLSLRERKRFLRALFSLWGAHRHRMAKQIGDFIAGEIGQGRVKIKKGESRVEGNFIHINGEAFRVGKVFDCRGPASDVRRSENALLKNMLQSGMIAPHETGWGIAADHSNRVLSAIKINPPLVIGPLLTGERLETIAVPELREQAKAGAEHLLAL